MMAAQGGKDVLNNIVRLQGGHVEIRVKPDRERGLGATYFRPAEIDIIVGRLDSLPSVEGASPRIMLPGLVTINRNTRKFKW